MILRYLAFAIALVTGVFTSQLPEFAQHYRQRMGGAIDELNRMLADFDADAARLSLTREQAIVRMKTNPDELVRWQGARVQENSARVVRIEQQLKDFASAGSLVRIGVLLRDFDAGVARRAANTYEPGVPVTGEGAVTTVFGAIVGWLFARLLFLPAMLRKRRPARVSV
jgi:hypothetical protein